MATNSRQESKNQIRKILEVLARHGDVISDALDGIVELSDRGYNAGVDALVEINALMPLDEGQYQLNPRIRAFLSEQLAKYSAFQTLTRISEQIHGAKAKWREIVQMKETGDLRDMGALEESMGYTIAEIVHFTSSNLLLLNTQIATDYGNVSTLRRKLAQNAFYSDGVKTLLAELQQLDAFTSEIEREAIGKGLYEIRQLINSRIRARMPDWLTRLNDVQATINRRLFVARQLEKELLFLSRIVLWLARNPTRNGVELEVTSAAPPVLVRPVTIKLRPQIDILNAQLQASQVLLTAASRLAPPKNPWARKEAPVNLQYVQSTEVAEIAEPLAPEDGLIADLVEAMGQDNAQATSVLHWRRAEREASGIDDEAWLLYVANQLNMLSVGAHFVMGPRQGADLNEVFVDLLAFPIGKSESETASAV